MTQVMLASDGTNRRSPESVLDATVCVTLPGVMLIEKLGFLISVVVLQRLDSNMCMIWLIRQIYL